MTLTFSQEPAHKVNWLKECPIAHRGLHVATSGIFENSLSAAKAAMSGGFAIEVDLQPSADGIPMVFHDYQLKRMTGVEADVRNLNASELTKLTLRQSDDKIPTFAQLLELVAGKVSLVLELKGHLPSDDGFVAAVAEQLKGYTGQVAIMSFAHHLLEDARQVAPHLPLGLTAEGDDRRYDTHKKIALETNVDFVSYEVENLETRFAKEFRNTTRPLISWTIRSKDQATYSYLHSDQPTFEGFEI